MPYKQALREICAALCSGVACLIAFWRMLGPASPNALVPQAAKPIIGQSEVDDKPFMSAFYPSSHLGLSKFHEREVKSGISRNYSIRPNHVSKATPRIEGVVNLSVSYWLLRLLASNLGSLGLLLRMAERTSIQMKSSPACVARCITDYVGQVLVRMRIDRIFHPARE